MKNKDLNVPYCVLENMFVLVDSESKNHHMNAIIFIESWYENYMKFNKWYVVFIPPKEKIFYQI